MSTSTGRGGTGTGRKILLVLLVLSVLVHAGTALLTPAAPLSAVSNGVVGLAALVALALVIRRADGPALLTAAVAGGLGVALFLVPGLIGVVGGQVWMAWLDPWAFGSLLLDAMVVRIAVFTLRRVQDPAS